MLRISYVKKTCPQCGNVYKICKSKMQASVGSLIADCKNVEISLWIQVLWSQLILWKIKSCTFVILDVKA